MDKEKDSKKAPYWLSTLSAFSVFLTTLLSGFFLLNLSTAENLFYELTDTLQFLSALFLMFIASVFFHMVLIGIRTMWKEGVTSKPK